MKLLSFVCVFLYLSMAWARPEYAVRYNNNRCTSCHFSPAGGGLRNVYGKAFGQWGFTASKASQQDYISADLRFLFYNPEKRSEANVKSGLFLMAGIIGGSVPLSAEDQKTEFRVVVSHEVLGQGRAWDSYLRVRRFKDTETSIAPQYFTFGRFHAPFGILSDEHRTYTRIQTQSTWNRDLENGLLISGQPFENIHWDVAAVNGNPNYQGLQEENAVNWGGIFNLRALSPFPSLPLLVGFSTKSYDLPDDQNSPWATSLYSILGFDNLTGGLVRGSLSVEVARAKHMNFNLESPNNITGDPGYRAAVVDSESEGLFVQLDWFVLPKLAVQFKYDELLADRDFSSDAFTRVGVGIKHYIASQSQVQIRYEQAEAGNPAEENLLTVGTLDSLWVMLQTGF